MTDPSGSDENRDSDLRRRDVLKAAGTVAVVSGVGFGATNALGATSATQLTCTQYASATKGKCPPPPGCDAGDELTDERIELDGQETYCYTATVPTDGDTVAIKAGQQCHVCAGLTPGQTYEFCVPESGSAISHIEFWDCQEVTTTTTTTTTTTEEPTTTTTTTEEPTTTTTTTEEPTQPSFQGCSQVCNVERCEDVVVVDAQTCEPVSDRAANSRAVMAATASSGAGN